MSFFPYRFVSGERSAALESERKRKQKSRFSRFSIAPFLFPSGVRALPPLSLSFPLSLSRNNHLSVESALIDGLADFHLPGDDSQDGGGQASDRAVGALLEAISSTCAPRLTLGSELFLRSSSPSSASTPTPTSSPLSPLPTGIPEIDALLHLGRGLPRGGLLTEVYGGPSSGKTQLALAAAATTAASGKRVLWLDASSGGAAAEREGGEDARASPFPGRRLATLVAAAAGIAPLPPPLPPAPAASTTAAASLPLPAALEAALERVVVVPVSRISEAAAALDLAVVAAAEEGARRRTREQQDQQGQEGFPSCASHSFALIVLDSAATLFGPVLGGGGSGASSSSGAGHAAMVSFLRSLKAAASALGAAALVTNHERSPSQSPFPSNASAFIPPPPALGESWRPQATLRLRLAAAGGDSSPAGGRGGGSGRGRPSFLRTAQLVRGGRGGGAAPTPWSVPLSGAR